MSRRSIKQNVELDKIDFEDLQHLVVVEIDGAHRPEGLESLITKELDCKKSPNLPFFPASSCNRHVYIFDIRSIDPDKTPNLYEAIQSGYKDFRLKIYTGAKEGLVFLLSWVSGGLNKGKHYQDTYNRKTVNLSLQAYLKLIEAYKTCETHKEFQEFYRKILTGIDSDKAKLEKLKEDSASTEMSSSASISTTSESSSSSNDSANSSRAPTPSNIEDNIKWLETSRKETKRIKEFNINRFSDDISREGFVNFITETFKVVDLLCSTLETTKHQYSAKLWSGNIKKESLEQLKESDLDLFKRIIDCRTDFVSSITEFLVDGAIEKTLTRPSLQKKVEDEFAARIEELNKEALLTFKSTTSSPTPLLVGVLKKLPQLNLLNN
jgi:hypothetical protein